MSCSSFPSAISKSLALGVTCFGLVFSSVEAESIPAVGGSVSLKFVGDGQTDQTEALQRAIDSGVGSIYLTKGSYVISKSLIVDLDKTGFTSITSDGTATLLMKGTGPAIHFKGTHNGSADPGTFKENVWQKQRMPLVSGIEIVGAHPEASGIESTGVMQLTVTKTVLRKLNHGIHLTVRNRNVLISDCHIYENEGCGVYLDQVNLHQINIIGSHISYNKGGGVVSRGGNVRNLHIGTCDVESNMAPDKPETANVLIDCANGSTGEVSVTGCTIQHNSKSPNSANIRFLGKGLLRNNSDQPSQEGHLTITGNVFSDVSVNIHLQEVRGATITGNTFWEGFDHDLLIENSQAVVIGPNDFDRNPRYSVNGKWAQDRNGLVFKNCSDSKINGVLIKGVWGKPAALLIENCRRMTLADISIFDSDGVGLWVKDSEKIKISDCFISDERPEPKMTHALKITGGSKHWLSHNQFEGPVENSNESPKP